MKKSLAIAIVALLIACFAFPAMAGDPFVGEKLKYEFGWSGFTAAEANVSIDDIVHNQEDCYKIVIKIKSLSRLEWIWKVRDKIVSYTRKKDLIPEYYFYEQREGKFALDTEIKHDKADGILRSTRTRYKKGNTKEYSPKWAYSKGTTDPLGALMHLRKSDLAVGKTYTVNTFDGKRQHTVEYKVVGKESIDTKFGPTECFKVVPRILKSSTKDSESKVEKVQEVTTWISTDPRHLVMRVESKVFIGFVFAELVEKN